MSASIPTTIPTTSLRASLPASSYYVYLDPDWQLTRDSDGKPLTPRVAVSGVLIIGASLLLLRYERA